MVLSETWEKSSKAGRSHLEGRCRNVSRVTSGHTIDRVTMDANLGNVLSLLLARRVVCAHHNGSLLSDSLDDRSPEKTHHNILTKDS